MLPDKRKILCITTCFNRPVLTNRCFESIFDYIKNPELFDFIVLDNSTNNLTRKVLKNHKKVQVVIGNPNLYWSESILYLLNIYASNYKYIIIFNDDCLFKPFVFNEIYNQFVSINKDNLILGGSFKETIKKDKLTYGGYLVSNKLLSTTFELVKPSNKILNVDLLNFNFVIMDSQFYINNFNHGLLNLKHQGLDWVVTLKSSMKSRNVYLSNKVFGYCKSNPVQGTYLDTNLKKLQRIKYLFSLKGYPFDSILMINKILFPKIYLFKAFFFYTKKIIYICIK